MVDPFGANPNPPFGAGAARARSDLDARFRHLRGAAGEAIGDRTSSPGGSSAAASFKAHASRAADEARGAAASFAEQARNRLVDIVEQQKSAGAERIAGVARAAQSAAKDLDDGNPQLAQLVRSAADGVDRIAADVRSRDIGDVIETLAAFGRRQPVAFFGSAVLTGFLIARFFKSDAPMVADPMPDRGRA